MDLAGEDEYRITAEFYDQIYRSRQDVAFFVEAAMEAAGPVLELGCGTGRVLIPTARSGVRIVGLDRSPHMLEVCRKRLLSEPKEVQSRVELMTADMRDFKLGHTFELITTPFRSFQHLTTSDDQCSCLEAIRRHLAKDGKLILDFFNPALERLIREDADREFGEGPEFTISDGRRVVRRERFFQKDLFNQIIHAEFIYYVTVCRQRKWDKMARCLRDTWGRCWSG